MILFALFIVDSFVLMHDNAHTQMQMHTARVFRDYLDAVNIQRLQ